MNTTSLFSIRDARADDRAAIRDLTLAAYAEYATIMAPTAWAGLRQAVLAGLEAEGAMERIVAEQEGVLLGSVMLYSPAANAYGDTVVEAGWPELRLLAVARRRAGRAWGRRWSRNVCGGRGALGRERWGCTHPKACKPPFGCTSAWALCARPKAISSPDGAELVMAYRVVLGDAH